MQLPNTSEASTSANTRSKTRSSVVGMGLYVNLDSGKQVLNPGGHSSMVIDEGTPMEADPNTRFPIPNEAKLRSEKRKRGQGTSSEGSVKGKSQQMKKFKAPRGKSETVDKEPILRRSPRGKNVISTIGSTTTS
ncbi:uncharacterized protein LOC130986743 [Salvia miltiorrhiza]|uniref:uncharacterized protein LOC130986743 n=1 Tax=Salvia miltiorrhiza TaxID=226208 RepID=UPI0025AB6082|nr:uncharacterized protein LOC130986743 [Salvia miltiorrhiza]